MVSAGKRSKGVRLEGAERERERKKNGTARGKGLLLRSEERQEEWGGGTGKKVKGAARMQFFSIRRKQRAVDKICIILRRAVPVR